MIGLRPIGSCTPVRSPRATPRIDRRFAISDRPRRDRRRRPFRRRGYVEKCRTIVGQRQLDAVTIATPDHLHVEPALAAIAAGCHVFCEKPLAAARRDARADGRGGRRSGACSWASITTAVLPLAIARPGNFGRGRDRRASNMSCCASAIARRRRRGPPSACDVHHAADASLRLDAGISAARFARMQAHMATGCTMPRFWCASVTSYAAVCQRRDRHDRGRLSRRSDAHGRMDGAGRHDRLDRGRRCHAARDSVRARSRPTALVRARSLSAGDERSIEPLSTTCRRSSNRRRRRRNPRHGPRWLDWLATGRGRRSSR